MSFIRQLSVRGIRSAGIAMLVSAGALFVTGCSGSGLVGEGVPQPTRSVLFGHRDTGAVTEGWIVVTQDKVACGDIAAVLAGTHDPGDSIWILMERGPSQPWEGLYPGTEASAPDSAEARHAEVYFHQSGDTAGLTGHDVWVRVISYEKDRFQAELDTSLAEGLLIADDCGEF